jgi:hypothetical protein
MDLENDSTVSARLNIIIKNIHKLKDSIKRLQRISKKNQISHKIINVDDKNNRYQRAVVELPT